MSQRPATVRVRVDFDSRSDPGEIAILLDLLEGARVASTWFVPPDADPALIDRLYFGGHVGSVADPEMADSDSADGSSKLGGDALGWLRGVQLAIGQALEHRSDWELRIDTAALKRPDSIDALAEALDLISGLVRAGRLRVASPLRS